MAERPKSWDLKKHTLYGVVYPSYQDDVIQREREQLLPWVNQPTGARSEVYFATDRDAIGKMALPYLLQLLQASPYPRHVLEIGGGEGKALLYLINALREQVPSLPTVLFTMTSLTEQPEQVELLQHGVTLKIPQIAEKLPDEWSESFDLVLTSALFGWADAEMSIREIRRVLKQGGYWLGLEAYDGMPIYQYATYQDLISSAMYMNQMENIVSDDVYTQQVRENDFFPVVYWKG